VVTTLNAIFSVTLSAFRPYRVIIITDSNYWHKQHKVIGRCDVNAGSSVT